MRTEIYLANHSLGRPLDATADDVAEARRAVADRAWARRGTDGRAEMTPIATDSRDCSARRAADCIVPKTSAGQGLRAILNTYDSVPRVVATRGEFDSIDVILRQYARRGRIALALRRGARRRTVRRAMTSRRGRAGADLVVVSQVVFNTGQVLARAARDHRRGARACGARVLLDVYHSLGVLPVDVAALDVDFAVGGSYKYLRGGPGACFLYLHPRHLDGSLTTLDVGWFAKKDAFAYQRPDPPQWGDGRRRVPGVDTAGADLVSGARGPDSHAGAGRRAAARLFAWRSSAG